MTPEEIERRFVAAGWVVPDSSSRLPLVGNRGDLSIVTHERMAVKSDDPLFELVDRGQVRSYWVRMIPTPLLAAGLLEELDGPPEEQWGNPYRSSE